MFLRNYAQKRRVTRVFNKSRECIGDADDDINIKDGTAADDITVHPFSFALVMRTCFKDSGLCCLPET